MKALDYLRKADYVQKDGCVAVGVAFYPPLSFFDGKEFRGICVDIVRTIMKKLHLCEKFVLSPGAIMGNEASNGSWNGVMGLVQRKEVEMVVCPVTQVLARYSVVDFSETVFSSRYSIMYKRPDLESNLVGFIMPFTIENWILTFATLIMMTMLSAILNKTVISRIMKCRNRTSGRTNSYLKNGLWLRGLISQDIPRIPREQGSRILIAIWLLMAMILGFSYKCNLKALLIFPKVTIPFDNLQELVNQNNYKWTFQAAATASHYFKPAYDHDPSSVMGRVWSHRGELFDHSSQVMEFVLGKKLAAIVPNLFATDFMSKDFSKESKCRLALTRGTMMSVSHVSFGFAKNSEIATSFNQFLAALRESGIIEKLTKDPSHNSTYCNVPPGKEIDYSIPRPLNLHNLLGIFYVYLIGNILGSLSFLWELVFGSFWKKDARDINAKEDVID